MMDWVAVRFFTFSEKKLNVVPCSNGIVASSFLRSTKPSEAMA